MTAKRHGGGEIEISAPTSVALATSAAHCTVSVVVRMMEAKTRSPVATSVKCSVDVPGTRKKYCKRERVMEGDRDAPLRAIDDTTKERVDPGSGNSIAFRPPPSPADTRDNAAALRRSSIRTAGAGAAGPRLRPPPRAVEFTTAVKSRLRAGTSCRPAADVVT